MRRAGTSERFEVDVDSPTVDLVTMIPEEQPDARAATAASNVRFSEGVVMNAPGYGVLVTIPQLPRVSVLVRDFAVGSGGSVSTRSVVGTANKIYAFSQYPDNHDTA